MFLEGQVPNTILDPPDALPDLFVNGDVLVEQDGQDGHDVPHVDLFTLGVRAHRQVLLHLQEDGDGDLAVQGSDASYNPAKSWNEPFLSY